MVETTKCLPWRLDRLATPNTQASHTKFLHQIDLPEPGTVALHLLGERTNLDKLYMYIINMSICFTA